MTHPFLKSSLALCVLALAACSSGTVKSTLGIGPSAPDEFRVVSRPPLSVPPQFSLRPPSATASAPGQIAASSQAKSLLTGASAAGAAETAGAPMLEPGTASTAVQPVTVASPSIAGSGAESQFLKKAGAAQADPNIRDTLTEEKIAVQNQQEDNSSWWNVFSSDTPKKDTLVNAKDESTRIEKDKDEGKPVTEGETPVVKDKDTGVLGRIFGY